MAITEKPLLDYTKGVLAAMTPASPAAATSRVYTIPDDYESVIATVPFITVYQQQDEIGFEGRRSTYPLIIAVHLHKGVLPWPSSGDAEMALKARAWLQEIVDWQREKKPFGTHGDRTAPYTAFIGQIQWDQEPYNGLFVSIPVLHHLGV